MKKLIPILLLLSSIGIYAQRSAYTNPQSFYIDPTSLPANLNVVEGTLTFSDADGDNTIGAEEQCTISFMVENTGKGDAMGCIARINGQGTTQGITFREIALPRIKSGEKLNVSYSLISNQFTQNGNAQFTMEVYEPNGFGTGELHLNVPTHQFDAPQVEVVSYKIGSQSENLQRKVPFTLQVMVQNVNVGTAKDVQVHLTTPSGITLLSNNSSTKIDILRPNDTQIVNYELIATVNAPDELNFSIDLKEHYGKYAKHEDITLALGEKSTPITGTIVSTRTEVQPIHRASLISSVDENIPISKKHNFNTFAVIIANENYQNVAKVQYAINDGNIFRQYCERTLGIPAQNIHQVTDATYNNIRYEVNWLKSIIQAYKGQAKIIFYYAGHGVPDEKSKDAYLLPVDGNDMDIQTGYKLDELYSFLGAEETESITIFLDACFSGAKREEGMITQARTAVIKAKSGQPKGNMVVFSAATGNETAYPNKSEGHGMFTYFLLRKLQETAGNTTYEELGDYIITNVQQQSIVLNGKSQTPTVTPSLTVKNWQHWKLK